MFKLLVADDEQIVLDSIKFIIEKNFSNLILVETARSGREAIEKAEILRPDIVFMDIKMPGINGIDTIKEIKALYNNIIFVILTAFEQFDYAKEALNLGVLEYISKPIDKNKIIDIIKKSMDIIEAERRKREKELELKEKMETVLPILESGFIYSLLLFDDYNRDLENYKKIFDITEDDGYIMTVEFGEEDKPGHLGNRIGSSVKSQSFYPYFRDMLKCRCKCLVGPVMLNRIVVFITVSRNTDEYTQRLEALDIAQYVYNKILEKVNIDLYVGIGRTYSGLENLHISYEESLKAIRYTNGNRIMHISDISEENRYKFEYPYYKEKILLDKASTGETAACIQAFNSIFDWLKNYCNSDLQDIKKRLVEVVVMLHRLVQDYGIEDDNLNIRQNYLGEFLEIGDINKLKSWCKTRIEQISSGIKNDREKKLNHLILKAKEYIDENFNKDITLEDVSREVCISPHYFSKLFKSETNQNFIDYLTSIRMGKAKKYLEDGEYSVKEICYQVGYCDPNYFSRIFKKIVGVTPTEFKEVPQNKH
ncbi:MAG: response regulator [Bacillota bacterium]|nr:response regulator [Bacillota bacterium]